MVAPLLGRLNGTGKPPKGQTSCCLLLYVREVLHTQFFNRNLIHKVGVGGDIYNSIDLAWTFPPGINESSLEK
jgi:hypothetical protein